MRGIPIFGFEIKRGTHESANEFSLNCMAYFLRTRATEKAVQRQVHVLT